MSENVKVVWPECGVCHGKGLKQVKEGWAVCDHTPPSVGNQIVADLGPPLSDVEEFVVAVRPMTLREQRQPDYGDPLTCHQAIGLAWGAILMQTKEGHFDTPTLSPRTVALMLAAMKLVREAYHHKQDNLDDARVYLEFVEEFSK